jgi:hypothetical protein
LATRATLPAGTALPTLATGASGRTAGLEFLKTQEAVAIRIELLEDGLAIRRLIPASGTRAATRAGTGATFASAALSTRTTFPAGAFAAAAGTARATRATLSAGTAGGLAGLEFFEAQFAVAVRVQLLENFLGARALLAAATAAGSAFSGTSSSRATAAGRLSARAAAAGTARRLGMCE